MIRYTRGVLDYDALTTEEAQGLLDALPAVADEASSIHNDWGGSYLAILGAVTAHRKRLQHVAGHVSSEVAQVAEAHARRLSEHVEAGVNPDDLLWRKADA